MSRRFCCSLLGCVLAASTGVLSAPVPVPKQEHPSREVEEARDDLRILKHRAADPQNSPEELWKLWQAFRVQHAGTQEYLQAAALMSKVPSPLDKLDRNQIPVEDRPPWLPKEVVAVLGDQRGRSWGGFEDLTFSRDGKLLLNGWQAWDAATLRERTNPFKGSEVVMSQDGKRAVVLTRVIPTRERRYWSSFIRLVEIRGEEIIVRAELLREEHYLHQLAWSQDGRLLLVRGKMRREPKRQNEDELTILYELKDNKLRLLHEIDSEISLVSQVAFALGGKYLLDNGGRREALRLWDLRGDKPKLCPPIPPVWFGRFSLSADGRTLAVKQPSRLRRWNAHAVAVWSLTEAGPQGRRFFEGTWPSLRRMQMSPDGTLLVCLAPNTKGIWLCPLTAARRRELGMGKDKDSKYYPLTFTPKGVAFDPDGRKLAIGGMDQIIHLWDWKKGEKVIAHSGHRGNVSDFSFSPDGRCLASVGDDGTIRFWEWGEKGARERMRVDTNWPLRSVAFTPDGAMLACREYTDKKTISFWEVRKKRPVQQEILQPHSEDEYFAGMAFAARGNVLLTTGYGKDPRSDNYSIGTACFWDYSSLPPCLISRIHLEDAEKKEDNRYTNVDLATVSLSPNGKQLAIVNRQREKSIEIWERHGRSWRKAFDRKFDANEGVGCLAFSMDGSTLIMGGLGKGEGRGLDAYYPVIRFWKTRGRLDEIRPPLKVVGFCSIDRVELSPDERRLALRSGGRISIWDIPTRRRLMELWGPNVFLFRNVFQFAPDGRHLASISPNGTVYVFRIPERFGKP